MLTYTFDDGSTSQSRAIEILGQYNQVGVLGAIGKFYDGTTTSPSKLSVDELLYFKQQGWEIASHSYSHSNMNQIPFTYSDEVVTGWTPIQAGSTVYRAQYSYGQLKVLLQGDEQLAQQQSVTEVGSNPGSYYTGRKQP